MKSQAHAALPTKAGKVQPIKGSNANVSHTINEDERQEFTSHINTVWKCAPNLLFILQPLISL
jgi:plastin-1